MKSLFQYWKTLYVSRLSPTSNSTEEKTKIVNKLNKLAKYFFCISIVLLLLLLFINLIERKDSKNRLGSDYNSELNKLTFSNTQVLENGLDQFIDAETKYLPSNWKESIHLMRNADNFSEVTYEELHELLVLQKGRTQNDIDQIVREVSPENIALLNIEWFANNLDVMKNYPHTIHLLLEAYKEINICILTFKNKFDRVRPSYLSSKLIPAIDNPNHAAYPSGHSAETHLMALLLGEVSPNNKSSALSDAGKIAKNREIAGVHYKSDSLAGQSLANQVFKLLKENEEFSQKIENAKFEWK